MQSSEDLSSASTQDSPPAQPSYRRPQERQHPSSYLRLSDGLPTDLLELSSRRLGAMILGISLVLVVTIVVQHIADDSGWGARGQGNAVALLSLSLLMMAIARSRRLKPRLVLDLGLIYQVICAFGIAVAENLVSWPETGYVRGVSWVCVWIVLFPLIVPASFGKVLLASVCSALAGPAAHVIAITAGKPRPSMLTAVTLYGPNLVAVAAALVATRIIYRLASEVSEARKLGSYTLVERLGRGGMGEVWRADHRNLPRSAAVKLIRPEILDRSSPNQTFTILRRFEREAKSTAKLRSPHTVELYDFGISSEGTIYYVMELLDGMDLQALVERFGPLPPERAVYLLRQACRSLEEAHDAGLVHRDIKPANLFVCQLGKQLDFVKILDFGLVKSLQISNESTAALTAEDMVGGTPAYMAPEMASIKNADSRVDIYALGCVAYFLLTGHTVFSAATPLDMMLKHIQEPPTPPSERTASAEAIPKPLEALVMACLAKNPDERPASATVIAKSLDGLSLPRPWSEERATAWWVERGPTLPL